MTPKEIIEKAKKELSDLTGFKFPGAIGIKKEDEGWLVTIEVIEKDSIPSAMDILGTYDVHINKTGSMVSYERKNLRKRSDTVS